ncbi:TetR/AcrR family transcriptional regulator [Corynebacterium pseudodiphtheriticum]|uniref:TetR/AcrR family transcriptional regulator n=1 Tax=Corynebacterium pseudodiphtheriticum TaxID=37637 RepID=UPI000F85BECC|nr:TetR/AcrR family transcriptional regulator [Corynebacterium pseudodiphtheriticum]MDK8576801.1 TetR/AcrR family transcriptional regulator [Corynebacterium pseudodiphtheriticum]MDK8684539.1 TetR/AcrR family transcriptional regulator [Corynebacterium pseudodiphtheriticum]RUP88274.1 TetR/AcrR family transcriptional regulator [Corynebacterium pseudodiphtheriticum]RUP93157.1 TetR/AcrR family transcriptional regulator [Corynebacterium pseudodiphtheriticum]RUP98084.1 TetR/AcrR family transcriptiona
MSSTHPNTESDASASSSPSSGSQQSRKRIPAEQRRRELTAVAHTVMARDGAFGLTTRAVAKEAGVPHGSVHYAFHSKDELIRAVVRDDIDRSTAAFRRFAAPEANTPEHTASPTEQATGSAAAPAQTEQAVSPEGILHAAFASYADNLIGDPWEEAAQQELALMCARDEQLRVIMQESNASYRELIGSILDYLAAATGKTWAQPADMLAENILGALFGTAQLWLIDRDDATLYASLATLAKVYAAQLGK